MTCKASIFPHQALTLKGNMVPVPQLESTALCVSVTIKLEPQPPQAHHHQAGLPLAPSARPLPSTQAVLSKQLVWTESSLSPRTALSLVCACA